MHNSHTIESFIEKVSKEANAAAQKVFDQYQSELEQRIRNQMKKGEKITVCMGSCYSSITNANEDFLKTLSDTQYRKKYLDAGFYITEIQK